MVLYDLALSFGGFELALLAQSPTGSMSLAGVGRDLHLPQSLCLHGMRLFISGGLNCFFPCPKN